MRTIRYFLATAALLAPLAAWAQSPTGGAVATTNCGGFLTGPGELYATKITDTGTALRHDFNFDLTAKGGGATPQSSYANGAYNLGITWRVAQGPTHVQYMVITLPPATPGGPGRFAVDSANQTDFDAFVTRPQEVGNSIPAGELSSVGLTIPGTTSQFGVPVRPGNVRQFPAGTTTRGINIAWAGPIDVNDTGVGGCSWGALQGDPASAPDAGAPGSSGIQGVIIGYNVYRMPGVGAAPTPAQVKAAIITPTMTDGGWVGFVDLRTLRQDIADNPGTTGPAPSPIEDNPTADIGGMQNPNGIAYDGDEIIMFQDRARTGPGLADRDGGAALNPAFDAVTGAALEDYWYFVQPVMVGNLADFNFDSTGPTGDPDTLPDAVGFTPNDDFLGEHRCDMDGDTLFDGLDLDNTTCNVATLEFISPQAEFGHAGYGLTFDSEPLLSAGMFFDNAVALPAAGQVRLSGTSTGADVNLQFTTGLEQGRVLGYNVYRVVGGSNVRVNEQPILAQGNDANVYTLVDTATQGVRGVRAGSLTYMVEIVYSDGSPSTTVGPFTVEMGSQTTAPARRRR